MFFNLIPLPPLDGSKVIFLFLSGSARRTYYTIQRYAMPILLVCMRHPETPANTERFFSGRRDVPLTERGRVEQTRGVDALVAFRPERIWCSPLSRCHDLAMRAASMLGVPCEDRDELVEFDFGTLEGTRFADAGTSGYPFPWPLDEDGHSMPAPQAESFEDVAARVDSLQEEILGLTGRTACVSHGGLLRMRPSLTLRDDDYRLSFLQGNFVTLTNLTDDDVERIIACSLEPMLVARYAIAAIALSADVSALDHTTLFGTPMSVIYLGCVLGHVFSPYLRFHGGKGIAVGFGAALGLWWPVAVGLLVVFLLFAVPTRYVSLGSVCAAASLPLWCLAFGFPPVSVVPVVAVAVVVIWAHRSNIRKLVNHDERRFSIHHEEEGGPR